MSSEKLSPIGALPVGWTVEKLANITIKIGSGSTPRGGDSAYVSDRVEFAFVRSQNVLDFHFNKSEIKYITNDDAKKLKGVHLQKNDILLNITGDGVTFGRSCIVPESILPAAVNQHVTIIRVNPELCLPGYLLAYLCLPTVKEYIGTFNAGGSRRAITKAHIESFDIPIAPKHIQRHIEKVTFDFLNKIDRNTQTNQTLESIAQAIFKSWFVDFEPVKAKMAVLAEGGTREQAELAAMRAISGKSEAELTQLQQQIPEHYQQLAETAELFPCTMMDSELGYIPDAWQILKAEDILQRLNVKNRYTKNDVTTYGITPVFEQGAGIVLGYHNDSAEIQASPENPVFIFGDHTCVMHLSCSPFDISANVIPLKGSMHPTIWTYYAILGKQEFQEYRRHWSELVVKDLIAPQNTLLTQAFEKMIKAIFLLKEELNKESSSLAELRDCLLPNLLSGELTTPLNEGN